MRGLEWPGPVAGQVEAERGGQNYSLHWPGGPWERWPGQEGGGTYSVRQKQLEGQELVPGARTRAGSRRKQGSRTRRGHMPWPGGGLAVRGFPALLARGHPGQTRQV